MDRKTKKSGDVIPFPVPKQAVDHKAMLGTLLDAFTLFVELEDDLRPLLRCEVLSSTGVGPKRCRHANLHPSQSMCGPCAADKKLDEVMEKLREAVR